jgi:hypothetical protein
MAERLKRFKKTSLASFSDRGFLARGYRDRTMRIHALVLAAAAIATIPFAVSAGTAAADGITITIKDHKFTPAEVRIPANKRMSIVVINDDATPEEFESLPMKIEKIIPGNSKALVRFGPIAPGRYEFIGEFNQATAKGVMIAE